MAKLPFNLLEEPETRQPSKVRIVLFILVILLLLMSVAFIVLYVVEKTQEKATDLSSETTINGTCISRGCVTSAADMIRKLDESTKPCDDFYQYSCGGFLKRTHLRENQDQSGGDTESAEFIQYSLKDIFENDKVMLDYSKDKNSAVYKAFVFYKSCMNESYISDAGMKPIFDVIEKYGSWNITNKDWSEDSWILEKTLARMAVDLSTFTFLKLDVARNILNTSKPFAIMVSRGNSGRSLNFDKKDFPNDIPKIFETVQDKSDFDNDFDENYKTFMSTILKLLGASDSIVDDEVERIYQLQEDFGNVGTTPLGEPSEYHEKVKLMTHEELNRFTSFKFNWTVYLKEVFRGSGRSLGPSEKVMLQTNNVKNVIDFIADKPKSLLANTMMWNVIRGLLPTLPMSMRNAGEKYEKDEYKKQPDPRWKTCLKLTKESFRYPATLLYVNEHVPEETLATSDQLFTEIKNEFINGLKEQKWMDDKTRANARRKLKMMRDNIGYPRFIKIPAKLNKVYENVKVDKSTLLQNRMSSLKNVMMQKIYMAGKHPDNDKFLVDLPPLMVNAFYYPFTNGMTILAGILQPPFYKKDTLKALTYGSLGMIVGHEITHGFDKEGSQYDGTGNVNQWWTDKSKENFVKRSKCLIDQYSKIKVFGVQVQGNVTLSENIADNGGLKYAYRAYQKWRKRNGIEANLPGLKFTNDQLFFISFAQVWCEKYKMDSIEFLISGSHSPNPVRVRVPVHNFPAFSKAFGCTPPKDTCAVW
ncbi:endothelin-converting enzyme 1-like [Dendronephthya gigantea]|uniref:endothelin-converting enzyme 1-like n=1 Tax=Dendronephthya gigantea TaxID=151771 RepID=UPI00106C08DA|nr:endothelin-converting enzyme 1-like [Dendronephthya gigantea]XP_028410353.1 endothelin-converting enzyme 1-like [Dendronephthya gigantea]XP_028410354.1 endothelin-converting enzyme 1-like [Dendronephthya gigantea]